MSEMKHLLSLGFALSLFAGVAFCYAQVFSYQSSATPLVTTQASYALATATAPVLSAAAYGVFDTLTGELLFGSALDEVHPIASVTKLFTATAILETFNPEATTTISWSDIATEGEAGKLRPRQTYAYRELLFPLLLESSNDAAASLERATHGELVAAMNTIAAEHGATATHFADASGLSAQNVSTVRDLVTFSRAVEAEYPFVYDIARLPQYIGTYTGWMNNNPVFDTDAYRGGKHGYTPEAGRTMVARFDESFTAGNRTVGYVVLGSQDMRADVAALRTFVADSVDYK